MTTVTDSAQIILDNILARFRLGQIAAPLAVSYIKLSGKDMPKRTGVNRLIMGCIGTSDARTFKQWSQVGRWPTKGSKAFLLVRPYTKSYVLEDSNTGERTPVEQITGWRAFPVFPLEATEGKELEMNTPPEPPPLMEVAEKWGIKVDYAPYQGAEKGSYWLDGKRIVLNVADTRTFFHELSHAAHDRIEKKRTHGVGLKGGQYLYQEAVAELSACVLNEICELPTVEGNTHHYLLNHCYGDKERMQRTCMEVISDVDKVVSLILETAEEIS